MKYLGAIDVGGTKTMIGIIAQDATLLGKVRFLTYTADCYIHFSDCCTRFKKLLAELDLTMNDLEGVGINMPGMVDAATGVLLQASFAGWYNIDVKRYFNQMLGIENLFIENDVNACAVGELIFGNACDNFLWVTVSTGIGGAIIINRKLVYGHNSCAGEIGHVKVEYEHPAQCSCGQWGCAEAQGSGTAITRMFAEQVEANLSLSALIAAKNLPVDAVSCALLAKEGNLIALGVYKTAGKYIGRALSYAANLLNPQKIYIGGGVADSLDLLLPSLNEELKKTMVKPCAGVEIEKTALAYDSALLGAAALVLIKNRFTL